MKFINKIFCSKVCLTSRKSILVILGILTTIAVLANVLNTPDVPIIIEEELTEEKECWVPTKEDIEYQDSMYAIIQNTQQDVDTIKQDIDKILYKLDRLDYKDGTHDSIRYVKGSEIDKRRNQ